MQIFQINNAEHIKNKPSFYAKKVSPNIVRNLEQDVFEHVMSQKERMIAGVEYITDHELWTDKNIAKDLCYRYNILHPEKREEQKQIMKQLLGKTGERFKIEPNFKCDYGYNIEIGERFFSNYNLVILDSAKVKFGDNVLVGPNCSFCTPSHPINPIERAEGKISAKPITVGNNVWFGANVTVLGGVNIGDNVIVGAGSVVTKDLPSNTKCYGNPCKVIQIIKDK